MVKIRALLLTCLLSIGAINCVLAMDLEVKKSMLEELSPENFLYIVNMLVPSDLTVTGAGNEFITVFVRLKLVCKVLCNWCSDAEFSKMVGQKNLNFLFVQDVLHGNNPQWITRFMQCGATIELPEPYMLELNLPYDSYPLPQAIVLVAMVTDSTRSEDYVLERSRAIVAGGAKVTFPAEPSWLYSLSHGTALDHAIKNKFNCVIDFLLAQGAPIEQQSLELAQQTDQQIYVRLMRCKFFGKNQNNGIVRPILEGCTIL